jgi:small-conductance mechanosensitive channel
MLPATPTRAELEQENARLQRLVAELLARNQQLRQALESATREIVAR